MKKLNYIFIKDTFGNCIEKPIKFNDIEFDMILLMGKKGVGKDTCGEYISKKIGWKTFALAKPVKDIAKIAFHLTEEQVNDNQLKEQQISHLYNRTPRIIMQMIYKELFTESLSKIFPEYGKLFFIHHMERQLDTINKSPKIIITDLRSPEYASYLKNKYKTLIIKIIRNSNDAKDSHISETEIDNFYSFDYLIENDGCLNELYSKLDLLFLKI
uniref:Deoxynucleoside monophosphate kinase n=1 Tax=viral metagenome TaxID=1070528 RepID=A0A6C0LUU8_9ZZZZ